MLSNITVRLKLSDLINTDQEKSIMEMICKTHNDLRAVILLHMWYDNDDVSPSDLNKFLIRWEDQLFFKTKIKKGSELAIDEFIFFDIIPTDANTNERYRFKYEYSNSSDITKGINQLYDCVKFITSDKPNKRQKRNDYED